MLQKKSSIIVLIIVLLLCSCPITEDSTTNIKVKTDEKIKPSITITRPETNGINIGKPETYSIIKMPI